MPFARPSISDLPPWYMALDGENQPQMLLNTWTMPLAKLLKKFTMGLTIDLAPFQSMVSICLPMFHSHCGQCLI